MQGVSKRYGGVRALQDADIVIEAGRIHAVLGENGAGKSTLIKIMAGVVAPDEGRISRAPAPTTSIRWRWSRTCRSPGGRWSRSPRRSPASRAS